MKINSLNINNFRNYKYCFLNFNSMVSIFFGKNAQGKTNLLEAIYYASYGFSHRTSQENDLMNDESNQMSVILDCEDKSGSYELKIKRFNNLKTKKEFYWNNVAVKTKEYYGSLKAVMFSPEDLQFIKGEPQLRRKFLDMQIAQTDKIFYDYLVKYNRILFQRNKLLKDIREGNSKEELLNLWDDELSKVAAKIIIKRVSSLNRLKEISAYIYGSITSNVEELNISYLLKKDHDNIELANSGVENESDLVNSLKLELLKRRKLDILRGSTSIGPHRDDLVFYVDNKLLKSFGSQGQQRSVALSLKLAQIEYIKEESGEYPVLLLDDVMSELDEERRFHLLKFIDGKVQTFITVNDKNLIPNFDDNEYFYVEKGEIKRC